MGALRYMGAMRAMRNVFNGEEARIAYRWAAPWWRFWHSSGAWNACSAWHVCSAWHAHVRWSHAFPVANAVKFWEWSAGEPSQMRLLVSSLYCLWVGECSTAVYCGDRVQRVTCVQCATWVSRVLRCRGPKPHALAGQQPAAIACESASARLPCVAGTTCSAWHACSAGHGCCACTACSAWHGCHACLAGMGHNTYPPTSSRGGILLWLPTVAKCVTCVQRVNCVQCATCVHCESWSTERKARNAHGWAAPWCRLWYSSGAWNACSAWRACSDCHAHLRWRLPLPAPDRVTFGWVLCVQCVHYVACVSRATCPGSVRVQHRGTAVVWGAWPACDMCANHFERSCPCPCRLRSSVSPASTACSACHACRARNRRVRRFDRRVRGRRCTTTEHRFQLGCVTCVRCDMCSKPFERRCLRHMPNVTVSLCKRRLRAVRDMRAVRAT